MKFIIKKNKFKKLLLGSVMSLMGLVVGCGPELANYRLEDEVKVERKMHTAAYYSYHCGENHCYSNYHPARWEVYMNSGRLLRKINYNNPIVFSEVYKNERVKVEFREEKNRGYGCRGFKLSSSSGKVMHIESSYCQKRHKSTHQDEKINQEEELSPEDEINEENLPELGGEETICQFKVSENQIINLNEEENTPCLQNFLEQQEELRKVFPFTISD